jgi:hypothetical protein
VLERGRVREVGRHDELLARPDSVYGRLHALQMVEQRSGETRLAVVTSGAAIVEAAGGPAARVRS